MAFNINQFASKVNAVNSLYRPSMFYVEITPPPWVFKSSGLFGNLSTAINLSNLRFLCSSANLPGVNTLLADVRTQGYGPIERRPYGVIFSDVATTFFMDNANVTLSFFHKWMQNIVQFNDSKTGATSDGGYPFEVGYYKDYATTVTIYFIDETGGFGIRRVELLNAYPTSVGDVTLNWNSTDDLALLPVNFTFKSFTTDWLEPVGTQGIVDRLFSALDQFQKIRTSVSTLQNLQAPSSVADAVNIVNNVGLIAPAL